MNKKDIGAICDILCEKDDILLLTHKSPDGDAVGSTAAMACLLEMMGKRVRIMYPEEPSARLQFILRGREYMTPERRSDFSPTLTVSLDCASAQRLGRLEQELAPQVELSIDHHLSNTPFASSTYTDPVASATCEMIYELAQELVSRGEILELSPDIAYPIYAGIVSDTGSFKYSNTSAHTFEVCAKLMETGIDIAEIARLMFDTAPLNKLRAEAIATQRLRLFADGKAAIIDISREILSENGLTYDDFDDVVNVARRVEGVEIGAYVRCADNGDYKVSLRSNSYADVASICEQHAGGGHLRAAGCAVQAQDLESAVEIIMRDVTSALEIK